MNTTNSAPAKMPRLAPLRSTPVECWSELAAAVVSFSGLAVESEWTDEPTQVYGEEKTVVERVGARS